MLWAMLVHVLEFVIGWVVVPKVFVFLVVLLLAYFGFPEAQSVVFVHVGKFLLMVALLLVRKAVALGYVLDYLADIFKIDLSLDMLKDLVA